MLAIDDPAFDRHVLPLLLSTPLAHSLPRARVDLRAHLDEIAKLIQLGADDVLWAFRYSPPPLPSPPLSFRFSEMLVLFRCNAYLNFS
jgi:hypothetical protein